MRARRCSQVTGRTTHCECRPVTRPPCVPATTGWPRHPGQQRGAPAKSRFDPRHHDRAVRLDIAHQPVRDVLDYKGRDSAHAAGLRHHQHQFGERVRAVREPARLRADKSGNCELHERAREADDQARHSRQRRGTRSVLDSAAGHPADRRRKTCRSSGSRCRWVALGSPPKLHRFTWNSHPRRRAT